MAKPHPIRCRCGKLQGEVNASARATRAVCYCRDCRAYAHFLGPPEGMLDEAGGTDVVAVRPSCVTFTSGVEHLACMSLSPRGTLRWYAGCCGTPIGNTPRDIRLSHLGLVHSALESSGQPLEAAFGPVKMRVNRESALGPTARNSPLVFSVALLLYLGTLLGARVTGNYKVNPFFVAGTGTPLVAPRVLTAAERAEVTRAAQPL